MSTATREDEFRLWAFFKYYHAYRHDLDMTHRFVRAIVESARPVAPSMIEAWKAARRDVAAIERAYRGKRLGIDQRDKEIRAAILARLGVKMDPRAWQVENPDNLVPDAPAAALPPHQLRDAAIPIGGKQ